MNRHSQHFKVTVIDHIRSEERLFEAGKHFRLNLLSISDHLDEPLTPRMIDLLRIASAVYFVDRLVKRSRLPNGNGWRRRLTCCVEVRDFDFWNSDSPLALLNRTLAFVSGDDWDISFTPSRNKVPYEWQKRLPFKQTPTICLYSGGLDSAAGLTKQLQNGQTGPIVPVMVRHRSDLGWQARRQLSFLTNRYGVELNPLVTTFSMQRPWSNENSQRTRSFLFNSLGAVAAWMSGASKVDVYESGVGAVNLPLLSGMAASRTTRSCHPYFLRLLSALFSEAAERTIQIELPFLHNTKGEIAASLSSDGLQELVSMTASCVRYPLRRKWMKSCGYCPACIFRRLALHTAGIQEPRRTYWYDLLGQDGNSIPFEKLKYLKAFLIQMDRLADLENGVVPRFFERHLLQTKVVGRDELLDPYVTLYRRYRDEWCSLLAKGRKENWQWVALSAPTETVTSI